MVTNWDKNLTPVGAGEAGQGVWSEGLATLSDADLPRRYPFRSERSFSQRCWQHLWRTPYYLGLTVCVLVAFLMIMLPLLVVGHGWRWMAARMGRAPEAAINLFSVPEAGRFPKGSATHP